MIYAQVRDRKVKNRGYTLFGPSRVRNLVLNSTLLNAISHVQLDSLKLEVKAW